MTVVLMMKMRKRTTEAITECFCLQTASYANQLPQVIYFNESAAWQC